MDMYICSIFVILMALHGQSSAFLLTSECPASLPCTCSGSSGSDISIHCEDKRLTAIPQIAQFNTTVNSLIIKLSINSLTTIPSNAFINLSYINASSIELFLQLNHINMIANDAFKGVENTIISLYLFYNKLTTIPFAISKLSHLQTLQIDRNPLSSIDPSVMPNIGGSLKTLSLEMAGFTEWPTDLHYLRKLQSLTVYSIPFSHLDINIFRGFEYTLTNLTIYDAELEKVPHAICRLTHLTKLMFSYNSKLKGNRSSIFEPCGHTLPTMTGLYLDGNKLYNFPDVFSLFPSLTDLQSRHNNLQHIKISVIPPNTHLTSIDLSYNQFERIPSALKNIETLKLLDIQHNEIRTIESCDLYGLSNLTHLYLSFNPLAYIEPNVFSHNPSLYDLRLQNTQIDHVPQAVIGLYNLRNLILDEIDCTCEMSYLKHWNVSAVTEFSTQCAYSTETIKTFVITSLQSCPDT